MKLSSRTLTSGMHYITRLPLSLLSNMGNGKTTASAECPAWVSERQDILERADWLAHKVIVSPAELLKEMPAELGKNFGGQWAIYSCAMFNAALANICRIYPDQKEKCLERMGQLIEIVNTPEIRRYDTISWHEDAMNHLEGEKSHLSYLSLLAWMISDYMLAGDDCNTYDDLYERCCEALNRRMLKSHDLNIPTFSNGIVFIPDMIPAIIALNNYSKLYDDRYASTVERWKASIRKRWIHKSTGLILAKSGKYRDPKGSYSALTCSYLSMVDEEFAREQYGLMKDVLGDIKFIMGKKMTGIREYLNYSPAFKFDPDAGPIVQGLSASGTAFAIGAATRLGDWRYRHDLLSTAEIAGSTQIGNGERHYRLAELALVGEAVTLAMRTNISR